MENADMLMSRFANETANGVRFVTKRNGITGYGAKYFSTKTKRKPETTLAANKPVTIGSDQGNSSVVFRQKANSRHPTAPTSVNDPKKSMRLSLSETL